VDFYLEAEKTDPGPIENAPGEFPPSGLVLSGADKGTPSHEDRNSQARTDLLREPAILTINTK
jgi:hypothetical protein